MEDRERKQEVPGNDVTGKPGPETLRDLPGGESAFGTGGGNLV